MKKRILSIFLVVFLSICVFSHGKLTKDFFYKNLPQDNKRWEKTKEEIKEGGFYQLEFVSEENPQEIIIVTFENREKDPNLPRSYYDGPSDLFSLLEKEEPSALQRMQELRQELKKIDSIYSVWKLLYVFNRDDIIYEYSIPELGPYKAHYEISRLIKKPEGYLKVTYKNSTAPSKESSLYLLQWLKELEIS